MNGSWFQTVQWKEILGCVQKAFLGWEYIEWRNAKSFKRVYRVLKAKISNRFRLFTSILIVLQQKPRDQSHSYFISVFHWKSKNNLSTNAEILNWKVPRFIAMVDCKRCCVRQQRELMANAKWNGKNEFCTWEQMRGMYTWCVGYIYYTELF